MLFRRGRMLVTSSSVGSALVCWLGLVAMTEGAVKLGKLVTPCSVKDPKLNECLTTQGQALLPHLIAGVKEWGIPPMDPLLLPMMKLQNGAGNAVGLSLSITNSSHYGWKDMTIKSITFDPKTLVLDFRPFFPTYTLHGTYKVDGRILLLPIRGNGFANLTFQNVDAKNIMKCQLEERGGKKYLKVDEVVNSFVAKNIIYRLDNLFGNKQLSDAMNGVLNQNPVEAFQDLKQPTQDVFSDLYYSILSRMFSKIPVNQMFKDFDQNDETPHA